MDKNILLFFYPLIFFLFCLSGRQYNPTQKIYRLETVLLHRFNIELAPKCFFSDSKWLLQHSICHKQINNKLRSCARHEHSAYENEEDYCCSVNGINCCGFCFGP